MCSKTWVTEQISEVMEHKWTEWGIEVQLNKQHDTSFDRSKSAHRGEELMRLNRHKGGWVPMMSLTVLTGTLFLPPSRPLSSSLSVSLHLCRHCEEAWEWQKGGEARGERGRKRRKRTKRLSSRTQIRISLNIYTASFRLRQQVHVTLSFLASLSHAQVSNTTSGQWKYPVFSQDISPLSRLDVVLFHAPV